MRMLPEARRFLQGLVLRLSKLTLGTWHLLNSLEGYDLLCVALIGFVLLLFDLVCSFYKFVRCRISSKFVRSRISSNVRKYVRRNRGKNWSLRKVFWREKNISRSAYVMLALQRLDYDRETGDLHIPMLAKESWKINQPKRAGRVITSSEIQIPNSEKKRKSN